LRPIDLAGLRASSNAFDASAVYLLARQRPARECTVEDHVAAMAHQAELDARAQTDLLGVVITAVFDRLDLSAAARATANELLKAELLEAAVRWEARQTKMAQLTVRDR
jgi:hypothetical protein